MLLSITILITIIYLMIELNNQLEIHSPLMLKPKEYTKKTLGRIINILYGLKYQIYIKGWRL